MAHSDIFIFLNVITNIFFFFLKIFFFFEIVAIFGIFCFILERFFVSWYNKLLFFNFFFYSISVITLITQQIILFDLGTKKIFAKYI